MNVDHLKDAFLDALGRTKPLAGAGVLWNDEVGALAWPARTPAPDYIVEAHLPQGQPWLLLLTESRTGYPRDLEASVRRLQEQLAFMRQRTEKPVDGVILADALSPDSRTTLQAQRVGYFDSGGSLYLERENLVILVDRPPPRVAKARMRSVFAPAREQVVHVLLHHGGDWITSERLQQLSGSSPGTVSETLKELHQLDWLDVDVDGKKRLRKLSQPAKLLDAWVEHRKSRRDPAKRFYRWTHHPKDLINHVASALFGSKTRYVLTGEAGANLVEPFLTATSEVTLSVVAGERDQVASRLDLTEASEGSNVTLVERPGLADFMFVQAVESQPKIVVASPYVLYADLMAGKGRSKEAAAHLRANDIGY